MTTAQAVSVAATGLSIGGGSQTSVVVGDARLTGPLKGLVHVLTTCPGATDYSYLYGSYLVLNSACSITLPTGVPGMTYVVG